jgi:tRNA-Thr(GGU) m(6)t(6)A37 methyltransferase TsaA
LITPRTFNFTEIGIFKSKQIEPYQAGRQPDELSETGVIELFSGENYEQALQDLEGCSHVWVIFGFHKNENWKPLVQTPRSKRKIGVFATRAPYRPNPIGLSLVKIISIDGLKITLAENDLLNDSPIFDIKPFHPESDSAEDAKIDWLRNTLASKNKINFSPLAEEQLEWLAANQLAEIKTFILRQLEYDPTNKNKKRVEEKLGYWTLAYRTWRIDFSSNENTIGILAIRSGYTEEELKSETDSYGDKKTHIKFNSIN